jgi:hypothetical protein
MNEKQFDPLDDRFRQAADQFNPLYDPEDWMAMEKLLDGEKVKERIFPFWWVTDAFMVGLLVLFTFQVNDKRNNALKANILINARDANTNGSPDVNLIIKEPTVKSSSTKVKEHNKSLFPEENVAILSNVGRPFIKKNSKADIGLDKASTEIEFVHITQAHEKHLPVLNFFEEKTGKKFQALEDSQLITRNEIENRIATTDTNVNKGDEISRFWQPISDSVKPTYLSQNERIPDSLNVSENIMPVSTTNLEAVSPDFKKPVNALISKRGDFFIAVSYGLEKSWVKGSSWGPSGSIYGGFAGYQLFSDWSIKLGILFTDKNYSGGSGIYKLPSGSYYREITNFRAICNILEIPLLINYQFKHAKNSNWIISAGPVSSIMKKEEYHYNYINNSGGTGYRKKYYSSNKVDWISGFRISPAYERYFGNRFSLSAESFIQLPLSGVGKGSVKLNSFGFQLSSSIHLGTLKHH